MIINIKNEEDLEDFYHNFKKIKGNKLEINIIGNISEKDKYELKQIERITGIKDQYEQTSVIYDEICNYIDKYLSVDICEFDNNGLCKAQRESKTKTKENGCCGKCMYVGKKGCTIKNITCKTFFCKYIKSIKKIPNYKDSKVYKYFLTKSQKLFLETSFWQTKEEIIKQLYNMNMARLLLTKSGRMKRY